MVSCFYIKLHFRQRLCLGFCVCYSSHSTRCSPRRHSIMHLFLRFPAPPHHHPHTHLSASPQSPLSLHPHGFFPILRNSLAKLPTHCTHLHAHTRPTIFIMCKLFGAAQNFPLHYSRLCHPRYGAFTGTSPDLPCKHSM